MTEITFQPSNKYRIGKRRILAAILDSFLISVPFIAITSNASTFGNYTLIAWMVALQPLVQISYSVLCHYFYGQTLAKSVLNIKVIDVSEDSKITLQQALLRDSVWIGMALLTIINNLFPEIGFIYENPIIGFIATLAQSFGSIWIILELVTMFTNKKRRSLHDYIAGTVVVKVQEV